MNDLSIKRWIFFTVQIYRKFYCRCSGDTVSVNVGQRGLVWTAMERTGGDFRLQRMGI